MKRRITFCLVLILLVPIIDPSPEMEAKFGFGILF